LPCFNNARAALELVEELLEGSPYADVVNVLRLRASKKQAFPDGSEESLTLSFPTTAEKAREVHIAQETTQRQDDKDRLVSDEAQRQVEEDREAMFDLGKDNACGWAYGYQKESAIELWTRAAALGHDGALGNLGSSVLWDKADY
jgi:hypothetical protein